MNDLIEDSLEIIIGYLNPTELVQLRAINKKFRTEYDSVYKRTWQVHIAKKWDIPTELVRKTLGKLSAECFKSLFPLCKPIVGRIYFDDREISLSKSESSAHYLGKVGESNRSIQGNVPFPRRRSKSTKQTSIIFSSINSVFASAYGMMNRIICTALPSETCLDENQFSGYSVPFALNSDNDTPKLYIKPRMVAYYEVEILSSNAQEGGETPRALECVAVGLATAAFMKNKRLPGWDNESYGYHGDDGAIFHGRGRQLAEFGPRFSRGDVVGCGLHCEKHTIFYTLNGKLLGNAFTDVPEELELFPTVGIDSNGIVHLNFGMEPFRFDLVSYLENDCA